MGISAFGTLLKTGDAATPEVFTAIAEVTDIGGPKLSQDTIEVTHHESPGGWREKIGGLLDAGEVSLSLNFSPVGATHTGLIADMVARTVRNFELVFPDAASTTWSFSALVTSFEVGEPIDDKLAADVTLDVTGQPTLT